MKYKILPHKMSSKSSRLLSKTLGAKRIYTNRRYKPFPNHLIINWGLSYEPPVLQNRHYNILNNFEAVNEISDKTKFFTTMEDTLLPTPSWTTSKEEALQWSEERQTVYCRALTRGHGGKGITVAVHPEQIIDTSLYTMKPFPTYKEARIHIFNTPETKSAFFQQKKKMSTEKLTEHKITETREDIRNFNFGWVFTINNIDIPEETQEIIIDSCYTAIEILELDFAAFDVLLTKDEFVFLEANSAPGLKGPTTLEFYKDNFLTILENR